MTIQQLEHYKDEYLRFLKIQLASESTIKTKMYSLNKFINVLRPLPIESMSEYDIVYTYLEHLADSTLSRQTISYHRKFLKSFLYYLYDHRYIENNLGRDIRGIKVDKKEPTALSPDDIKLVSDKLNQGLNFYLTRLLESSESEQKVAYGEYYVYYRNYLMFYTLLYTGIRVSELVTIRRQDINFMEKTISFYSKKVRKYRKNPVLNNYLDIARNFYDVTAKFDQVYGCDYLKRSDYLFYSRKDTSKPMTTRQVERIFKQIFGTLHMDYTPHSIRHSFGSLTSAIDLNSSSELLSHSSKLTTARYYAHSLGMKRRRNVLEEAFKFMDE